MKTVNIIYGLSILFAISSCGVSQSDYDKLENEKKELSKENKRLSAELDECQNGAERIVAKVEKAYALKDYSEARLNINKLYDKHPESSMNKELKQLLKKIEKEELAEQKRKEAAEKERIRLENLNNTGMWTVSYYVDDFGEPTKEGYIRNTDLIAGTFSNTATQNSALNVKFLITNSSDISIMLYEYAGNNPVKAYSSEWYTVLVQDKDGSRIKLSAINRSDRLQFNTDGSRKIHHILMKGGDVKFKIIEDDAPTTQYQFKIKKADWYENAYAKLKES